MDDDDDDDDDDNDNDCDDDDYHDAVYKSNSLLRLVGIL